MSKLKTRESASCVFDLVQAPFFFLEFLFLDNFFFLNVKTNAKSFKFFEIFLLKNTQNIFLFTSLFSNVIAWAYIFDMCYLACVKTPHLLYKIFNYYFHYSYLVYIPNSNKIPLSINKLNFGSNWLEREIIEFSNLIFLNIKDSRRLLTNYLNYTVESQVKNNVSKNSNFLTHNPNQLYFNNTYYTIF